MSLLFPDWPDAACRHADPRLFFPPDIEWLEERKARERQARAICAGCPVRLPCLEWAMARQFEWGIWGGADFGAIHGPMCKNRIHVMDGSNAWLSGNGSLVCLACRAAYENRRGRKQETEGEEAA